MLNASLYLLFYLDIWIFVNGLAVLLIFFPVIVGWTCMHDTIPFSNLFFLFDALWVPSYWRVAFVSYLYILHLNVIILHVNLLQNAFSWFVFSCY